MNIICTPSTFNVRNILTRTAPDTRFPNISPVKISKMHKNALLCNDRAHALRLLTYSTF